MARNLVRRASRTTAFARGVRVQSFNTGFPSVISSEPAELLIIGPPGPWNMGSGQTLLIDWELRDAIGDSVSTLNRPVTFSSSSTPVATVSVAAIVTAVAAGTATVTATDSISSLSGDTLVTVTNPQSSAASVRFVGIGSTVTTTSGDTTVITAEFLDSAGTVLIGQTAVWSSSSTHVSTISSIGGDPQHRAILTAISASTATCSISVST